VVTARVAAADTQPDTQPDAAAEDRSPERERLEMFARTPGSPNDPIAPMLDQALAVQTRDGFALEGDEAPVLLDGYRISTRQGDGTPTVTSAAIRRVWLRSEGHAADAESGALELSSGPSLLGAELSTREAAIYLGNATVRLATLGPLVSRFVPAERELSITSAPASVGAQGQAAYRLSPHLVVELDAMVSRGGVTYYTDRTEHADQRVHVSDDEQRLTLGEHYHRGPWRAELSQSLGTSTSVAERGLAQHEDRDVLALETRDDVRRELGEVAGLTQVAWSFGGEAHVRRHDLDLAGPPEDRENVPRVSALPFDGLAPDLAGAAAPGRAGSVDDTSHVFKGVVWTPDVAASTGVVAHLSTRISTHLGLRLDAFGKELALEPRGEIIADLGHELQAQLTAGAYRRPPERGEELEHELHPERTTRISLQLARFRREGERGLTCAAQLYYADRTRLIERDGFGALGNTGNGTTYGAFAFASEHVGHWLAQVSIKLEHSERQDAYRERVRPYEYDQPVALDARLQHRHGAWLVGAHFALREGLPATPVLDATFDSDRDVYVPRFGMLYTERLPWQHQLDLRLDRELSAGRVHLTAYLDIANVYDHRSTVGWAYNFNYTQRRAIESLPILPTLGVRGQL
jgi:hypothetical protein